MPLHRATVSTKAGALRVASIYLPNGNPTGTDKYTYKIKWMERLAKYAHERLQLEEPLIMAGDTTSSQPPDVTIRRPGPPTLFLPQTRRSSAA
jgi:exodeoxyribonuclease-3